MRIFFLVVAVIFEIFGIGSKIVSAADIYIDPSAVVNGSGSFSSPYNTWSGVSIIAENDYRQKCGTIYTTTSEGLVITAQGSAENHIIIGAYYSDSGSPAHEDNNPSLGIKCGNDADKPIITQATKNVGNTIKTLDDGSNQYLELNSISARKGWAAVNVASSNYNWVRYCYLYDSVRGVTVGFSGIANNNTVEYNDINLNHIGPDENSNTGNGIEFVRGAYNVAQHNQVTSFDHGGIELHGNSNTHNFVLNNFIFGDQEIEDACLLLGVTSYATIKYNRCVNAGQIVEMNGTTDSFVGYNIGTGNPPWDGQAFGVGALPCRHDICDDHAVFSNFSGNMIVNNTFYDGSKNPNNHGIGIYAGPDEVYGSGLSENNYFINNIIQKTGANGRCITVGDVVGIVGINYFYNNACYEYGSGKYAAIEGALYSDATSFNIRSDASGNSDNDPKMVDPVNENYILQSDSPAIDSGYDAGSEYDDGLSPGTALPPNIVSLLNQNSNGFGWEQGAYIYTESQDSDPPIAPTGLAVE